VNGEEVTREVVGDRLEVAVDGVEGMGGEGSRDCGKERVSLASTGRKGD
jgi:hypothetical protein